jgi:hypothetical protein
MTDKKHFADEVRDHATDDDSRHAHPAPDHHPWSDMPKAHLAHVGRERVMADFGTALPDAAFTGTGRWLRMDEPEEFDRILDAFLVRVRATGALRPREPGK